MDYKKDFLTSKQKMEYIILHTIEGTKQLIEAVNQKIAEGWEPLGGVCANTLDFSEHSMPPANALYQAMIKRN
jgi:hypothetical protein